MAIQNPAFSLQLDGVSKVYRSYPTPRHRLLEVFSAGRLAYAKEKWALQDVSLQLEQGARLGIVGENGSGKSTLLKILAGVVTPTRGAVHVQGRVSALLELGAGFNPELTGLENIRQFCMLYGMHGDAVEEAQSNIKGFSDLGDAISHPVKTYSSGMAVRLGFSCAVYVQPDILIIDEALSVGDAYFQNKCLQKIKQMLDQGTTFLYVTHSPDSIRSLCDRAIWLDKGKVRMSGSAKDVGAFYQTHVFNKITNHQAPSSAQSDEHNSDTVAGTTESSNTFVDRVKPFRSGSGEFLIEDVVVLDRHGNETGSVRVDESMSIRVLFRQCQPYVDPVYLNVGITDKNGLQIIHFNPMCQGVVPFGDRIGEIQVLEISFKNPFCPGQFGVVAGLATMYQSPTQNAQYMIDTVIDYCPGGACFSVVAPDEPINKDLWGLVQTDFKASIYLAS